MDDEQLKRAYDAYNDQDLSRLTELISDDVDWPDDDDGRLHGKAAVVEYWVAQWTRMRATDSVGAVARLSEHVRAVYIDQMILSTSGEAISAGRFAHIVHVDQNRILRLDIVPLRGTP